MEYIAADLEAEDPIHVWFKDLEEELSAYLAKRNDFTTYLLERDA